MLDTSTAVALSALDDPHTLPAEPLITAVTLAELSVGPLVASDPKEQAARQAVLQQVEADFEPLPFDADAARAFGESQPACAVPDARRRPEPPTR